MVWQTSDRRILFSTFGEPLDYNIDQPNPETYSVIVTSVDYSYEGEFPQHKGVTLTFLTTLLLKEGAQIRIRGMEMTITSFESQADGLFLVRGSVI